jgi:hypothetical protein
MMSELSEDDVPVPVALVPVPVPEALVPVPVPVALVPVLVLVPVPPGHKVLLRTMPEFKQRARSHELTDVLQQLSWFTANPVVLACVRLHMTSVCT